MKQEIKRVKLFINGQFVDSSDHEEFFSNNPATGERIARFDVPSEEDIKLATQSAKKAFYSSAWKAYTPEKRALLLEQIAEGIEKRREEFEYWERLDSGSTVHKAKLDVTNSIKIFKAMAHILRGMDFKYHNPLASKPGYTKNYLLKEPVGVVAGIVPWNFPLKMAVRKLAPALAAGCTIVLKSAEETPVTAALLAEVIQQTKIPPGVVNIITGGEAIGRVLLKQPEVRKISFTGSTSVGREIMTNASKSIQKLSLELGGKSANIVLENADLSYTIDGILFGFLFHSGQSCSAGTRILVHENIYDEFVDKICTRMKEIKIGDPSKPENGMGPIINKRQFDRIIDYIQETKNEGANLLAGGNRLTGKELDKGYYIAPTLFEITPQNTIFQEEVFGPVAGITKFSTDQEAIDLANNSIYGLAGAIWSTDESRAQNLASQVETGTLWINEYHQNSDYMPFGGYKQSGIGRELGEEGIESFLESKHLVVSDCLDRSKREWYKSLFG